MNVIVVNLVIPIKTLKSSLVMHQMFAFTGTPIFEENSQSKAGLKLTTDYLFNQCLHQYVDCGCYP